MESSEQRQVICAYYVYLGTAWYTRLMNRVCSNFRYVTLECVRGNPWRDSRNLWFGRGNLLRHRDGIDSSSLLQFVDQPPLRLRIGIHVSLCGLNAAMSGESLNIA